VIAFSLDDDAFDRLADAIAARVAGRIGRLEQNGDDGWLTTKEAATYLGISVAALHRYTAARQIPFEQATPRGKCFFRRSELDAWRAS
jgi:excisionase family DNA binding protein